MRRLFGVFEKDASGILARLIFGSALIFAYAVGVSCRGRRSVRRLFFCKNHGQKNGQKKNGAEQNAKISHIFSGYPSRDGSGSKAEDHKGIQAALFQLSAVFQRDPSVKAHDRLSEVVRAEGGGDLDARAFGKGVVLQGAQKGYGYVCKPI